MSDELVTAAIVTTAGVVIGTLLARAADLPGAAVVPVDRSASIVPAVGAPGFRIDRPGAASAPPRTLAELRNRGDREVAARTAWGEARSDGRRGMALVLSVIANRADRPGYGGSTPKAVSLAPFQFSVWNEPGTDTNTQRALNVTPDDPNYRLALELYDRVIGLGNRDDVPAHLRSADHYHTVSLPAPGFTRRLVRLGDSGAHRFYTTAV